MSGYDAEHGLISIDEALDLIQKNTQPLATHELELNRAFNHYLAKEIYSSINLPLFSQSAVDGYALRGDSDHTILANTTFEIIGEVRAGQDTAHILQQGQALRIFTGAKIPTGTTTVARQEIVERLQDQTLNFPTIQITEDLKVHADIRDAGEEIRIGQCLAEQGQLLTVGAIAALSMAGIHKVHVFQPPRVAVVITGDEIITSMDDLVSGLIFDANAPLIETWFKQRQYDIDIYHVVDTAQTLKDLFIDLSQKYQCIISTGGVSVGDYDFIRPVALEIGFQQIFWKVKQKPGKPIFFAKLENANQKPCYLLGLPGNPAAVYVGMQIYTATLLAALQGQACSLSWFKAELQHDLKPDARDRFLRMTLSFEHATLKVKSLAKQQSHMLSNLMQANCLVRIPAHHRPKTGDVVSGIMI